MVTLMLLGLAAAAVVPAWTQYHQPCRDTKHGPDFGLIRMADSGPPPHLNVSCVWTYPTRPDRSLLIRVDSMHLPADDLRLSSLTLVLDDDEIEIPRNCVSCLTRNFITTGRAKVLYRSVLLKSVDESPSDAATRQVGSFQIRYRSYDPSRCDSPKHAVNGFASISGRDVGHEIVYGCRPPYDVSGADRALCIVKDELQSPVPEWSAPAPKCVVTNCSSTVYRTVGPGALASPGYPLYVIPSAVDCRWVLRAEPGGQIQVSFTFLQLSDETGSLGTLTLLDRQDRLLHFYNETSEDSTALVINSSEVAVHLVTTNSRPISAGFYMEYQPLKKSCSAPARPENGDVLFTELDVGSTATYTCSSEYNLVGETRTSCQGNGTWSGAPARCVPIVDFNVEDNILSENDSIPAPSSVTEAASSTTAPPVTIPRTEHPKVTKPPKKVKLKSTGKPLEKATTKSKSLDSPNTLVSNFSEITRSEEDDDNLSSKDVKENGKEPLSFNSAQAKVTKPKNQENSTSIKQKNLPDEKSVVALKLPDSSDPFPHLGKEEDTNMLDVLQEEEKTRQVLGLKIYIIIGAASVLLLIILGVVVALVIYRKRFPVRLGFGRKFSTFENPVYVSKDAQHNRELKRLTI